MVCGVCFDLDNGEGIEYLYGVEVPDDADASELADNFELRKLSSFTYAIFNHEGHVSGNRQTCDVIWKEWLPESGYSNSKAADFFFERYGGNYDTQAGKGGIEIWIPVNA